MPTHKSQIVDAKGEHFQITVSSAGEMRARAARDGRLQSLHDAASDHGRNEEHWRAADGLDSGSANSPGVRKSLRDKARYEYCNNGFAKGLAWTIATDLIGTSVRVQFRSGNKTLDRLLEQRIGKWMRKQKLARKLRVARIARSVDGEGFLIRQFSSRMRGPIKTGLRLVECDFFDDPMGMESEDYVSGVRLNPRDQEPVSYTMMKRHPGNLLAGWNLETETVKAEDLVHWMREERGGQVRAVSEMCQSLSLYGQGRRLSLATLDAAEAAASIAAIFYTQGMPMDEDGMPDYDKDVEAFDDSLSIRHGQYLALPRGYKAEQLKAEQPTATFGDFQESITNEAGRGQIAPSHKARGNSSGYNYSSVRMDDQGYFKVLKTERQDLGDDHLEKIAAWYFEEAVRVYPEFRNIDPWDLPEHVWYFDGQPHVDEEKHAKATRLMVDMELKSKDDVLLEEGIDPESHWEKIREQRIREAELNELGPAPGQPATAPVPEDDDEETEDYGDESDTENDTDDE